MTRIARVTLDLAAFVAPGLPQATRGHLGTAAIFSGAAATAILGGAMGASFVTCTCPLVAAAVLFPIIGAASIAQAIFASRRAAPRPAGGPRARASMGVALLVAAFPFLMLAVVRALVVDLFVVPTDSMAPTLRPGDTLFVSRISLAERGAVAVFQGDGERLYVKRVAAVGGDRVEIRNGELWLNDEPAPLFLDAHTDDPLTGRYYTRSGGRGHRVLFRTPFAARRSLAARVVPRGYLFMLGDNRDHSDDSRSFGFVPVTALLGRAFALGPRHTAEGLDWGRLGFLL